MENRLVYVQYTMARDECCRSDLVFFEEVVAVFAEQVDAGYHGGAVAQTRRYQTRMTCNSQWIQSAALYAVIEVAVSLVWKGIGSTVNLPFLMD